MRYLKEAFRKPLWLGLIATALLLTFVSQLHLHRWQLTSSLEYAIRDFSTQSIAKELEETRVVLVDINEQSLKNVNPWPWSRQVFAELIGTLLQKYDAKIVALDIVLPSSRDPTGDRAIAQLAESKKLVLSQVFDFSKRESPILTGMPAGALAMGQIRAAGVEASGYVANHQGLSRANCVGNIGFIPDSDGKLRSVVDWVSWQGKSYPSLSYAIFGCLQGEENLRATLATEPEPTRTLRFNRTLESWIVIPADEVLNAAKKSGISADRSDPLAPLLRDRIVIIGSSALGLADRVATPLSANTSGMLIHAQALSELLDRPLEPRKNILRTLFSLGQLVLISIFGLGLAMLKSVRAIALLALAALLIWSLLVWSSVALVIDVPVSAALLGLAFLATTMIPMRWAIDLSQTRTIRELLGRYVSKDVLKRILQAGNFNPMIPRQAYITVLVADMASYTATIESLSLEQAAKVTKKFLEYITEPVWSCGGTLDRYRGDGLIAFWGAPEKLDDPEDQAIKAALQMLEKVRDLNITLRSEGLPSVDMRIGIASGEALVGDFGTRHRATYTAVGNCINLASRLESIAKIYPLTDKILVSSRVAENTKAYKAIPVGAVPIDGLGEQNIFTISR